MEYGEQEAYKPSKYNSGFLVILRINELWKDANNHARKGNFVSWNEDLDRIWMELVGDIKQEEGEKNPEEQYKELVLKYAKACNIQSKGNGFEERDNEQRKSTALKKNALMDRETFLRKLQNQQGKGTAYQEEEDDWE